MGRTPGWEAKKLRLVVRVGEISLSHNERTLGQDPSVLCRRGKGSMKMMFSSSRWGWGTTTALARGSMFHDVETLMVIDA
jgi:hypothetical protein